MPWSTTTFQRNATSRTAPTSRPAPPLSPSCAAVELRTAVNSWDWSLKLSYNQAEIIEGPTRGVICAGQTAVDATGNPQHLGDMRGQIGLALDNLAAILGGAGMDLIHVTRLGVYATDVDEALKNFDVLGMRFGAVKNAPPMTLLGVTRLAIPGLLFEIEATACA